MRVLATVGLVVITAVGVMSCRSDEQLVRAWYEERHAAVEDLLPLVEECDRYFVEFAVMQDALGRDLDRHDVEIEAIAAHRRAGYLTAEQMIRLIQDQTDELVAGVKSSEDKFWSSRGLHGVQRGYCSGRLWSRYIHESDSVNCRVFVNMALNEMVASPYDLGGAGYCLMYGPEAFEGN